MIEKKLALGVLAFAAAGGAVADSSDLSYAAVVDGIYVYDVSAYVQNGLLAHFDGIRNAGASAAHDPSATTWVNLGTSGGNASFNKASDDEGAWTEDGYSFHHSYAQVASAFALGEEFTVQWVGDITTSVQETSFPNYFSAPGDWCIFTRNTGDVLEWKSVNPEIFSSRPRLSGWNGKNFSAVATSTNCYLTQTAEYATTQARSSTASTDAKQWAFGGSPGGSADRYTLGVTHAVRVYGRALTEDELLQNLTVDKYRYTYPGSMPVTNVLVASEIPELTGADDNGVYAVATVHDFTAPASRTLDGNTYTNAGYSIETWRDESGTWGEPEFFAGQTYSYTTGVSTAKVRLTWLWSMSQGERRYDADEYARNGLILHLDGIRNVGLGEPHSETTTVWANLADESNPAPITELSGSTNYWCGRGYFFGDGAYAQVETAVDPGLQSTVQAVTDFDRFEQRPVNYRRFPTIVGTPGDNFNLYIENTNGTAIMRMNDITGTRNTISWSGKYLTGIYDYDRHTLFQGTTPGNYVTGTLAKNIGAQRFCLGSSTKGLGPRYMLGEIFAMRLYDRILTERELALNYELDEVRFRGAVPVSDTVFIDSNHRTLGGDDDKGPYTFVGGIARTFAASVTNATVNGKDLVLEGYTLETWDPDKKMWGDPVSHAGSQYVYAAGTDRANVRLTWQWKVVRGVKSSYDVDDYARGGLLLLLDGTRNAGAESGHDSAAERWDDLSGNGHHAYFRSVDEGGLGYLTGGSGSWGDAGYVFAGDSYACTPYELCVGRRFTTQIACDVDFSEQVSSWPTYLGNIKDNGNFYTGGQGSTLNLKTDAINGSNYTNGRSILSGWGGKSATGFVDDAKTCLFETGTIGTWQERTFIAAMPNRRWSVGSAPERSASPRYMVGTIHATRIYDRILSAEEVARNYAVDANRFRGAGLATTNVVVASASADAQGVESNGVYEVEGEWTFSASDVLDGDGKVSVAADGYTLESWSDGAWGAATRHTGTNYTYTVTSESVPVRLTWLWRDPKGTMVLVR